MLIAIACFVAAAVIIIVSWPEQPQGEWKIVLPSPSAILHSLYESIPGWPFSRWGNVGVFLLAGIIALSISSTVNPFRKEKVAKIFGIGGCASLLIAAIFFFGIFISDVTKMARRSDAIKDLQDNGRDTLWMSAQELDFELRRVNRMGMYPTKLESQITNENGL